MTFPGNHEKYVTAICADLESKRARNKKSIEKYALSFGITNQNLVKELTELAIVINARKIARDGSLSIQERYLEIIGLYNSQVNLSHRTSHSMMFQQYSTPAPVAFLAGIYVMGGGFTGVKIINGTPYKPKYFEPSAGNGLLTIALPIGFTWVNEIDGIRSENLAYQQYPVQTSLDASLSFQNKYNDFFDGIITNPPFGTLDNPVMYDGYKIAALDHLMALRALDTMMDGGRAAIIIGGHTTWDEQGRIQAGKNRMFFNYLYGHYHVDDVINLDGHKLYSRQGTSFDVRLILVSGRKQTPEGVAPLKNGHDTVVYSFADLYDRVSKHVSRIAEKSSSGIAAGKTKALAIAKARARARLRTN